MHTCFRFVDAGDQRWFHQGLQLWWVKRMLSSPCIQMQPDSRCIADRPVNMPGILKHRYLNQRQVFLFEDKMQVRYSCSKIEALTFDDKACPVSKSEHMFSLERRRMKAGEFSVVLQLPQNRCFRLCKCSGDTIDNHADCLCTTRLGFAFPFPFGRPARFCDGPRPKSLASDWGATCKPSA